MQGDSGNDTWAGIGLSNPQVWVNEAKVMGLLVFL